MKKTSIIVAVLVAIPMMAQAATPQKGSAFYTDVHGAGALIRSMDAMSAIDPSYGAYRDQAVDWSLRQIHPFPTGGKTWLQNPSAPKGHRSYHSAITTISAFNSMTMLQLYEKTKDPAQLQIVKDNVDWLLSTAKKKETEFGEVYMWTSRHTLEDPQPQFFPLTAGHSWGVGSTLDLLASYYLVTKDERLVPYLIGGARFVYAVAKKSGAGDEERIYVECRDPNRGIVMGYCRGNAGTAYSLLRVAEALPGAKITDDHTIEDVVNANLRYILGEAKKNEQGIIWANMNGRVGEVNLGFGRGITGIGGVMLIGYEMNKGADNDVMAKRCHDAATDTVQAFIRYVEGLSPEEAMSEFVGTTAFTETIGICSGISGSFMWLWKYADAVRDDQPALAIQCDEAIRKVAYRLINTAYDVDGTYAWKNHTAKFGKDTVNMAIDHGQTGAVQALAIIGARLEDERIIDGAKKAAQFVLNQTVQDGDGIKMPHIVRLDPAAKRVVDLKNTSS